MDELYVASRRALLDALEALADQIGSVILIGAHAVYVYTGEADVPIATRTKDSDLALDPSQLQDSPLLRATLSWARLASSVDCEGGTSDISRRADRHLGRNRSFWTSSECSRRAGSFRCAGFPGHRLVGSRPIPGQ